MIEMICALAEDNAIGKDNSLLWSIPEDMKHFREKTSGHTVVMGRKTWESIPIKFRPLPNRKNIVLSRDSEYDATGAEVWSIDEFLSSYLHDEETVFVIGGAEIYEKFLPYTQTLHLTRVLDRFPEADAFFPDFTCNDEFDMVECSPEYGEYLKFKFQTFKRKNK